MQVGMLLCQRLGRRFDATGDGHVGGCLGLHHLETDHGSTVEVSITASLGGAAGHAGDIRQANVPASSGGQHHGAERLDGLRRTQHTHSLLPPAHLRAAARRIDAGAAQGAVDLRGGQVEGLQARGVQGDVDLPVDASHPDYLADALLGDQAARDGVVQQPAQFKV